MERRDWSTVTERRIHSALIDRFLWSAGIPARLP